MKIVVTGGAGFIGSHIVDRYVNLGHDVVVIDNLSSGNRENINAGARFVECDITDASFKSIIAIERPTVINHHAAQSRVVSSVLDPANDVKQNIYGLVCVLQSAVGSGVKQIIFPSSAGTVYGNTEASPIFEEHRIAPISPYGMSKAIGEQYLAYFEQVAGLRYVALRYANVYGIRDNMESDHVITSFLQKLVMHEPPTIHWDGEQSKDYIYVSDVVDLNELVLGAEESSTLNVGTSTSISICARCSSASRRSRRS